MKHYRNLIIALGAWLLVWVYLSWPAVQDDAFIHLRYAVNLLQHHMISYDGVHQDYGTSSLLYVWLLASFRELTKSAVLPRAVSTVFHLALFGGLAWAFPRALRSAPKLAWGFAVLLLATLVMPMAVRWLEDGMETSFALCLVALIAFAISRLGHSEVVSRRSMVWLFVLGFIATLTRVEYLLLLGVASLTLSLERNSLLEGAARGLRERLRLAAVCASPLIGSLLAAGLIFLTMHALVPDTAVAKSDSHPSWMGTTHAIVSVLVSSLSFGALLLLFWLLTVVAVIVYRRRASLAMLAANSLFPVTFFLAAMRGQAVQGIRYFTWTLVFPILWNTLELRWSASEPAPSVTRVLRFATYSLVGVLVVLAPIESRLLYVEFHAREQSLAEFRAQHLERLHSLRLVAYDIGYIGYFTEAPVCDMAGLVNGRGVARLSAEQRVERCAEEDPQMAFLRNTDIGGLNYRFSLKGWSVCSTYDFANLRSPDPHYLIASPAVAKEVCAAAGHAAQPLILMPGPTP